MAAWRRLQKTIKEVNAVTGLLRELLQDVLSDVFCDACLFAGDLGQQSLIVLLALIDSLPEVCVLAVTFL